MVVQSWYVPVQVQGGRPELVRTSTGTGWSSTVGTYQYRYRVVVHSWYVPVQVQGGRPQLVRTSTGTGWSSTVGTYQYRYRVVVLIHAL